MKKNKSSFYIGIAVVALIMVLSACSKANKEKMIHELMETDLAFSEMSGDKGVKRACLNYIDTNGILLKDGQMPIDGKNAVIEHFRNYSDSGYVLSWKPIGADIAVSGNMGYTYGVYQIASIDSVSKGTYVTIWKKSEKDGWKLVLDSDNEGISQVN
jgi:ketosteroid isomerase-like protein